MNIENENYASFWDRLMAFNIDFTIMLLSLFPFRILLDREDVFTVVAILFILTYNAAFECSPRMATPGKTYMRLKIRSKDGSKISILKSIGRFFLKMLFASPILMVFTLIFFYTKKQGIHDYLLKTIVVVSSAKNANNNPLNKK